MRFGILLLLLLSIFACSKQARESKQKDGRAGKVFRHTYGPGGQYSYFIYVPGKVLEGDQAPLIVALDAHGRGKKAMGLFRKAMAGEDYLIAGLNSFSNSAPEPVALVRPGIQDILRRYQANQERITLFGFSGGARAAGAIASADPKINALFASAAGFDVQHNMKNKSQFHAFLAAGIYDFNYWEIQRLSRELSASGISRHLTTFKGDHEYPPQQTIQEMLLWERFKAMRNGKLKKNSALINAFIKTQSSKADSLLAQQKSYKAYKVLGKTINFLEGLHIPRNILKQYQKLSNFTQVKNHMKNQQKYERLEKQMQMEYYKALNHKNANWWRNQIKNLEVQLKDAPAPKKPVYRRLKNFLGMIFFTSTRNSFRNDPYSTRRFLKLYGLVAPENPDYWFFRAKYQARQGHTDTAMAYLQESLQKGFIHESWIVRDSLLRPIYQKLDTSSGP